MVWSSGHRRRFMNLVTTDLMIFSLPKLLCYLINVVIALKEYTCCAQTICYVLPDVSSAAKEAPFVEGGSWH